MQEAPKPIRTTTNNLRNSVKLDSKINNEKKVEKKSCC